MNKLSKQQNSALIVNTVEKLTKKEVTIYNSHVSAKRLKDFASKEDLLLVNSLIVRWANYVGVPTPDAEQINLVANFIKENFPSLNQHDIQEAIRLVTSQELETDAEPYGTISPIYVAKVLKAYQEHKNAILHKVRQAQEKERELQVKPIPDPERIENFKKLLLIAKEENATGLFYVDAGDSIYNFIKYNKLISLTPELIKEAMDFGQKMYDERIKKKVMESVIKHKAFKSLADMKFEKEDSIKKDAREFVVNRWLSVLDLNELLQKINIEMLKY